MNCREIENGGKNEGGVEERLGESTSRSSLGLYGRNFTAVSRAHTQVQKRQFFCYEIKRAKKSVLCVLDKTLGSSYIGKVHQ